MAINKVLDFPKPEFKKDIQGFVGLMNTLRYWCNKLNASCPSIRSLAIKSTVWNWTATHQEEFEKVKEMASGVNFLSPYDPIRNSCFKQMAVSLVWGISFTTKETVLHYPQYLQKQRLKKRKSSDRDH